MTAHHHVVGDSSPFLKRVLIPFWIVRIFVMVVDIAIYGLAIGVIAALGSNSSRLQDDYGANISIGTALAILVVIMLIIMACLALDIVCIVKRARRTLTPRFFLIVNVIQTTVWTILFILSMIGVRTGLSVAIGVIIYLSFFGVLIYAAVVFHQHRTGKLRGTYVATNNPSEHQGLAYASQEGIAPHYPQPYSGQTYGGQQYPKPAYYDPQAANAAYGPESHELGYRQA